jgi:hypothetical protein
MGRGFPECTGFIGKGRREFRGKKVDGAMADGDGKSGFSVLDVDGLSHGFPHDKGNGEV